MLDTFTWSPLVDAAADVKLRAVETQFGDGYAAAVGDGLNTKLQNWDLEFHGNGVYIDDITAFLDSHGGATSFLWKPPRAVAPTTFRASAYKLIAHGNDHYTLTVTFMYRPTP